MERIIRTKAFYSVMYGCGLRFGEAINLWWDKNIDWTHNKIHIKNRKAKDGFPSFSIKNHQDRSIPAPQWTMECLKQLKQISHRNNPYVFLTEDSVTGRFKCSQVWALQNQPVNRTLSYRFPW